MSQQARAYTEDQVAYLPSFLDHNAPHPQPGFWPQGVTGLGRGENDPDPD
jgi:hypothetical protein